MSSMKDHFKNLGLFHLWANNRVRMTLKDISFESLKDVETPYGPLISIVAHLFGATELWLKRIEGSSPTAMLSFKDFKNWISIEQRWKEIDENFLTVIQGLTNADFDKELAYTSLEGKSLKTTIANILIHVSNHMTHHRGQISALLRVNKLIKVPDVDFIEYVYSNH